MLQEDTSDLETIKIKTLPAKSGLKITDDSCSYIFSEKPIREKFGKSVRDFKYVGIMAHIQPEEDPAFDLLLSDGVNLISEPAVITSVKKK